MKKAKRTPEQPESDSSAAFHPAVREWFEAVFESPTLPQKLGWPAISKGERVALLLGSIARTAFRRAS